MTGGGGETVEVRELPVIAEEKRRGVPSVAVSVEGEG